MGRKLMSNGSARILPFDLKGTKGKFIAFDGMDRSGKTTLIDTTVNTFNARELSFITASGGMLRDTRVADLYGDYPDEIVYMWFWQSHRLLDIEVVTPALKEDKIILCDRYALSNMAFNFWTDLDPRFQDQMADIYIERCILPDLQFILVAPYSTFIDRDDGDTVLDENNYNRIMRTYLEWGERLRKHGSRVEVIDGSRPAHKVYDEVLCLIDEEIKWPE